MRRRPGTLLPLESEILDTALRLRRGDDDDDGFHGFALAKSLAGDGKTLTAHGTLYKALGRLETAGLLESRWEDAEAAQCEGRPRRRLYTVTGAGHLALAAHRADAAPGAAFGQAAWDAP